MDDELRTYLRGMEKRLIARTDSKLDESFTHWSKLILGEMGARFAEVNTRLESIDSRLRLHAGLLQSGARAMARFSQFSENSEERWVDLATRVERLERRLDAK